MAVTRIIAPVEIRKYYRRCDVKMSFRTAICLKPVNPDGTGRGRGAV
jgi:hypothetical protein